MIEFLTDLFGPPFLSYLFGQILKGIAKRYKKYEPIRNRIMHYWFDLWLPAQWSPLQRHRKFLEKGEIISNRHAGHIPEDEVSDFDQKKITEKVIERSINDES